MSKPFEAFFKGDKEIIHPLFKGAKILTAKEAAGVDLGPLTQLQGKWVSKTLSGSLIAGWNVISVPGPISASQKDGFVLEVIPYTEELTFCPIVAAGNRGAFQADGTTENQQQITGLLYQQIITSTCAADKPCTDRGFPKGSEIHAERGLLLFIQNFTENYDIARLSVIPHGNTLLALGQSFIGPPLNNDFFGKASTLPTDLRGISLPGLGMDQFGTRQFAAFDQEDPNTFLATTLGKDEITAMTTLSFSTANPNGGILNIPFVTNNADAIQLTSNFYIETIEGQSALQLQYTQTINLVFPPTGSATKVLWPHVTINTLTKVSDSCE